MTDEDKRKPKRKATRTDNLDSDTVEALQLLVSRINAAAEKSDLLSENLPKGAHRDFASVLKSGFEQSLGSALHHLGKMNPAAASNLRKQLSPTLSQISAPKAELLDSDLSTEAILKKIQGRPLWKDRDRNARLSPYQFFMQHYSDYLLIPLTGSALHQYDEPLYTAIHVSGSRHADQKIRLPSKSSILQEKYDQFRTQNAAFSPAEIVILGRMLSAPPRKKKR